MRWPFCWVVAVGKRRREIEKEMSRALLLESLIRSRASGVKAGHRAAALESLACWWGLPGCSFLALIHSGISELPGSLTTHKHTPKTHTQSGANTHRPLRPQEIPFCVTIFESLSKCFGEKKSMTSSICLDEFQRLSFTATVSAVRAELKQWK